MWIYGKNVIFNRILTQKKIHQILLTKNSHDELKKFLEFHKLKLSNNIIQICEKKKIEYIIGQDVSHQSIIANIDPINLISENNFLSKNFEKKPNILIFDQINDPQNIGAIIRSAIAFNIEHIFVNKRSFPINSATIFKTSAGYIDNIKLYSYQNLNNLLSDLKNIDYWCIGLDGNAQNDISIIDNYENIAIILGSEGLGIRSLVKKNCDLLVKINMNPKVESLNVSNAAAIILHKISSKL